MATSEMNSKQNELSNYKDQVTSLNENLHHKTVCMDDTSMKFEIARAEQTRGQTENIMLSKDCESAKQENCNLLEIQRQLVRQKEVESTRNSDFNNE